MQRQVTWENEIGIMECLVEAAKLPYVDPFLERLRTHQKNTYRHSIHVAGLSVQLGSLYGLSDNRLFDLAAGALLHDIGKLRIPVSIIYSPAALTPEERDFIKLHPLYSYNMLSESEIEHPLIVDLICLMHHYKMNLSGYPNRDDFPVEIDASRVPTEAQIVSVADMFDAMVSPRPYKEPFSGIEALGNLYMDAKKKELDLKIVTCLDRLFASNSIIFQLGITSDNGYMFRQ